MLKTLLPLLTLALLLGACPAGDNKPEPKPTGESAAGLVIGTTFDGKPLTVGKGELEGKSVVVTYFATW